MSVDNFISAVRSESKVSRAGKPFKIWYIDLDDGRSLKMGFDKPKYAVGQRLVGNATPNKFGDLEFSEAGAPTPTPAAKPHPVGAASGRKFPLDATSPEVSIVRQNALTNANTAVNNFYEFNGHSPETLDDYIEKVIDTAYKFAEFSTGLREVRRVKAMTEE